MRKAISVLLTCVLAAGITGCSDYQEQSLSDVTEVTVSYENSRISYLGPEGTYTQEACGVFFEGEGEYIPYETVKDAVEALVSGECDYAVIPQENTIGGAVADYVDTLIGTPEVSVAGEVVLTINQNLLVMPGAELDDIDTVYSHPQGIAQGREWIEQNLPGADIVEVSSTAEGARMVAEAGDPSCAAIASAGCAEVYGLEILAEAIQNNDNNRTRFYVLMADEPSQTGCGRLAFTASGLAADLTVVLSGIDAAGAELVTIHDRPLRTELGSYSYVIECEGLTYEDYLEITDSSDMEFRYLGCFEVR